MSCIYNQCISLSIKGNIIEMHVVAIMVLEIYCALEAKHKYLGSADNAWTGVRRSFHDPSTNLLGAF